MFPVVYIAPLARYHIHTVIFPVPTMPLASLDEVFRLASMLR